MYQDYRKGRQWPHYVHAGRPGYVYRQSHKIDLWVSLGPRIESLLEWLDSLLARLFVPRTVRTVKVYNHRPRPQPSEKIQAFLALGLERVSAWIATTSRGEQRVMEFVLMIVLASIAVISGPVFR